MKKSILFYSLLWCIVLGLAFVNIYAQQISLGTSLKSDIMNPDAECTGTGELIYDDGTFENGYGWNAALVTEGRSVMLFTPPAYPWQFNTICFAFTQNQSSTLDFDVVVYDDDGTGGEPGTVIGEVTGFTASGIPVWPTLAFYDFDISSLPPLTAGSWFLGIRWNSVPTYPGTFVGADESPTTTLQPGYGWNDNSGTWEAYTISFPPYRAMGIRTLGSSGPPCPIDPPTNPDPADGSLDVDINLASIDWTNGAGADSVEVWFDGVMVYDGLAVSTYPVPGPLTYATMYTWNVIGKNDTCSVSGPNWTFTTIQNPLLVIDTLYVYPQSADYWTGSTDGVTKTDTSEVRAYGTDEDGWMMFDISAITDAAIITEITYFGYVNSTNWPYWSATPLPGLNPLTATASELKTAIQANTAQGTAYIYSNETSGFAPGWYNYLCESWTNTDLQTALAQDWFAMGIGSRDVSNTFFAEWDGWAEANVPYLCVVYEYIIPVELTSFAASANGDAVTLNWSTATELNNLGFEVQRSYESEFVTIGFVDGKGTTTEIQNYSFTDKKLQYGTYSYRLKQVDFDGSFEYSGVVEVDVSVPDVFALEQNYPNPFNPSTRIEFSIAVDSRVSLKVFDILGQEVVTLINSDLGAGAHNVDFNASSLNSGVYFYRIEATGIDGTNFTNVKKMILTK